MMATKIKRYTPWILVMMLTVLNITALFRPVNADPGDQIAVRTITGGGYGSTGSTLDASGNGQFDGDLTVGGSIALGDDEIATFGDDSDWSFGYDSTLDAAVLVDASSNVLWKFTDLGTTAYPVAEATVSETHRATAGTTNEVANRLSLNDTNGDALTSAEWRSKWTSDTLSSEASQTSWYTRTGGTLAEKLRLSGDGTLRTIYSASIYSQFYSNGTLYYYATTGGVLKIQDTMASGGAAVDFDATASDGSSNELYRFGRLAGSTSGNHRLEGYNGDSTLRWYISNKTGSAQFYGNMTFGDAASDTTTCVSAFFPRQVTDAGPMTATNGTIGEIVFNLSDSKFYGCTVTGTPATWAAFH